MLRGLYLSKGYITSKPKNFTGTNMVNFFQNFSVRTKYGAMATAVFGSIYVAGAYIYRTLKKKERLQGPRLSRSMSIAVLHGGQLALKRLLEYHKARAEKSAVDVAECELKAQLVKQHPDYKKLQSIIAMLEMSGKEDQAVKILEDAIKKARNEGKNHEAYENDMLLVEMLIYKGDFDKALRRECLKHVEISDARRPLYQAIIHIMLDKHDKLEVNKFWTDFNDLKEAFHCAPSQKETLEDSKIHKLSTKYEEFVKVVNLLKKDIEEQARENKNKSN